MTVDFFLASNYKELLSITIWFYFSRGHVVGGGTVDIAFRPLEELVFSEDISDSGIAN